MNNEISKVISLHAGSNPRPFKSAGLFGGYLAFGKSVHEHAEALAENGCATTEIVGAGHKGAEIMIYSRVEDTVADEVDALNLKDFGEGPDLPYVCLPITARRSCSSLSRQFSKSSGGFSRVAFFAVLSSISSAVKIDARL